MTQKKILFVCHDANRAGSQLLLLQLIRLLKERNVPMHLLLCDGGELEKEFEQVISITRHYHQNPDGTTQPITDKFLKKVSLYKLYEEYNIQKANDRTIAELKSQNIGVLFINSVANATVYHDFLRFFHDLPVVLFVHELAMSVKIYSDEKHLGFLLRKTDHLIAVAQTVANFYVKKYDFPIRNVSTFTLIDHELIDQKTAHIQHGVLETNYKIPQEAIIIGGCGNAEWRKGNDIFNWIARKVIQTTSPLPVYFVWVGAGPQHEIYELIESDIRLMGLSDKIILIPPTPHVLDYLNRFDVLLLSSREDPYPLVVLEAALQEIPVICFKDAGGAPELIEKDAGFVVPFLDIDAAAEAAIKLVLDPALRDSMGQRARQKVLERHNTVKSIGNIEAIIQKFIPLQVSEKQNQ
ncbi:glycosyltransferase family 4 protein [Dyadobacter tibetensis]|uniref:glycosyltransferase family 4 protein n=1 Tax=Dyadobacter tibetensis TaxID=1211851 RepID=UPI00047001BD|nr:glycosyltransferase family 4 protein [Dyadobacter tibetensis]